MTPNRFQANPSYPRNVFSVSFLVPRGIPVTICDDLSEPEAKLLAMRFNRLLDDQDMRRLEAQVAAINATTLAQTV